MKDDMSSPGRPDRGNHPLTSACYFIHVRLENKPSLNHFRQDMMHFVEMKDEVELADILKRAVERFDEDLLLSI